MSYTAIICGIEYPLSFDGVPFKVTEGDSTGDVVKEEDLGVDKSNYSITMKSEGEVIFQKPITINENWDKEELKQRALSIANDYFRGE